MPFCYCFLKLYFYISYAFIWHRTWFKIFFKNYPVFNDNKKFNVGIQTNGSIKYFKIILIFLPRYLCGNNMIKMTSESSCQSENIIILLPGVPQILNLTIQLNIDRLVSFTQPLVNRLSAALVSGDGPVLDALQLIVDAWTGCCGHCWTRPS